MVKFVFLSVLGIGLGFSAYLMACFVNTSPAFSVRRVEVHGNQRTLKRDILHAVGITKGTNVFSLDLEKIQNHILDLPWVREATSARVVPDTLVIKVKEHEPVALIDLGSLYYVSMNAEVFKRVQPTEPVDLPVLTGFLRDDYNREPSLVRKQTVECLELLDKVRSLTCLKRHRVAEIHKDNLMGPTVVIDPGAISIRFAGRDIDARLCTLCKVLGRLADRNLKPNTILLNHENKPSWATVRLDEETIARMSS